MTVGIEIGKRTLLALTTVELTDLVVSLPYVLLAAVGLYVVYNGQHPAIETGGASVLNPRVPSISSESARHRPCCSGTAARYRDESFSRSE